MSKPTKAEQRAVAEAAATAATDALAALRDGGSGDDELDLADDEVRAGLSQLGGGSEVRWRVECVRPIAHAGVIDTIATEQLDPDYFREAYGPGEYRITGRDAHGAYIRGSHLKVKISDRAARAGGTAERSTSSSAERGILELLEQRERERSRDRRDMIIALATPAATLASALLTRKPDFDVGALVLAVLNREQGTPLSEMTTALKNLEELRGGRSDKSSEVLEAAIELMDRFGATPHKEGDDDSWVGMLKGFLPAIREIMAARAQGRGAQPAAVQGAAAAPNAPRPRIANVPPGSVAPPPVSPAGSSPGQPSSAGLPAAPTSQVADSSANPSPASEEVPPAPSPVSPGSNGHSAAIDVQQEMLYRIAEPWLRRQAENLENWSAADMDPELAAETLLAAVPQHFRKFVTLEQLRELIGRADWWQQLVQFHAPLADSHAWCVKVHTELVDIIDEELEEPPAEAERGAGELSPGVNGGTGSTPSI